MDELPETLPSRRRPLVVVEERDDELDELPRQVAGNVPSFRDILCAPRLYMDSSVHVIASTHSFGLTLPSGLSGVN
jgi:hypothetical protein